MLDARWATISVDEWFNLNASIRRAVDPLALMQRVADQAHAALDGADEVLVGLLVEDGSLRYVCAAGHTAEHLGAEVSLQAGVCGRALREGRTVLVSDSDRRRERDPARADGGGSMVCVPLMRPDGPLGVLDARSRRPDAFTPPELVLLAGLAEFVSAVVGAARDFSRVTSRLAGEARSAGREGDEPEGPVREDPALAAGGRFAANLPGSEEDREQAARAWVEQIVTARDFSLVFQPIFDLEDSSMLAAEALVRFSAWGSKTPQAVISLAHRVGLGVELEVAIVQAALAHLGELPASTLLSLNASPAALASGGVAEALAETPAERVVVELTEQTRVEEHPELAGALQDLRATGARLAIDDAGAGFASLMHILRLAPDYIKLDGELISSIDVDPVRRSLAASLMRFSEETRSVTIAERIETAAELHALRELGVRYGQGFQLARPVPASELPRALARAAAGLAA
jgi:EAL domain-containing protein (putative c-di-GMP-specific phosphodiesterase class I)/putative methionine-R-sulfoxide reductase with GAF domain